MSKFGKVIESILNPTHRLSEGFSGSDAEYMAAVKSGDMDLAQSMVDEAAQKAGYKEKWLHGTINSGFTHFDKNKVANSILGKGFYFTSSDQAAENYASKDVRVNFDLVGKIEKLAKEKDIDYNSAKAEIMQGESSVDEYFIRRRGSLEVFKGETLFHHINSEMLEGKVADNNGKEIDAWTLAKLTDEVKGKKAEEVLKTLNKYNASSSLTSIAEALGYTSILLDETLAPKGQAGEEQLIVFNPNQIKSADPVTYDSGGQVIPLSERFNENSDSIHR